MSDAIIVIVVAASVRQRVQIADVRSCVSRVKNQQGGGRSRRDELIVKIRFTKKKRYVSQEVRPSSGSIVRMAANVFNKIKTENSEDRCKSDRMLSWLDKKCLHY
jgi:hypothetical protein